ncbi:hypothetical protein [Celeribacter sp. ULVN23_4]
MALQAGLADGLSAAAGEPEEGVSEGHGSEHFVQPAQGDAKVSKNGEFEEASPDASVDEDSEQSVDDFGVVTSGLVAAAGRTGQTSDAGAANAAAVEILAEARGAEDARIGVDSGVSPSVDLFEDDDGDGLLGDVLDPIIGDDGLVASLLDALLGEGGILDTLLGDESLVGTLLDTLIGEGGLLDLDALETLLGPDGLLGSALTELLGDESLLAELLGEDGVIDDLMDALVGEDGVLSSILDPILGDGVLDGVLGEGGIISDVVDDLFGEDGLLNDLVGDLPIVGGLVGDGGLLSGLLGLGGGGDETADVDGEEEGDFLDTLIGLDASAGDVGAVLGDVTDAVFDGVDDVLTGLLGDEDVFDIDVPETALGGFDDLFAGLVGEDSLTGALADQGLLADDGGLPLDGEIDNLLSEILGPSSPDVIAGGDALDAILGEVAGDSGDAVGGLLAETGELAGALVDTVGLEDTLLGGLFPDDDAAQ